MKPRISVAFATTLTGAATLLVSVIAHAGPELVAFPNDYEKGVRYTTVDRPDNKQYRELFTSAAAVAAAKKGEPLPNGTVITLVQYAAKLDAQGNPEKGADGRFIKGNLVAYTVMEKRTGWGAGYAPEIRNGEWEYAAYKADKTLNTAANHENCFKCHKPLDARLDFVFSYDKMKTAP